MSQVLKRQPSIIWPFLNSFSFIQAIKKQNADIGETDHLCPVSKCAGSSPPPGCNDNVYVEHFSDTYLYKTPTSKPLLQRQQDTLTDSSYNYSPTQFGSFLAYVKDCKTTAKPWNGSLEYETPSTCLYINENQVNFKSLFNEYITYFIAIQ